MLLDTWVVGRTSYLFFPEDVLRNVFQSHLKVFHSFILSTQAHRTTVLDMEGRCVIDLGPLPLCAGSFYFLSIVHVT